MSTGGKRQVVAQLNELGIRPSKKLGQSFLIDPNLIEKMVRTAGAGGWYPIVEIGPGLGDLSCALLNTGAEVTGVELDRRLCEYLREISEREPRFHLIEGDACRVDYDRIMGEQLYRTVSSLPYSASTPIIGRFLEIRNCPEQMVVLLQREVGERLCASPKDNKTYGSLSVRAQHAYHVQIESYAPPDVFYPSPQVHSALVRMTAKSPFPSQEERLALRKVCEVGFRHRRKKLRSALIQEYGERRTTDVFTRLNLAEDLRPEALTPDTFRALALALHED